MEQSNKTNSLEDFVNDLENQIFESEFGIDKKPEPQQWRDIDSMVFPEDRWLVRNLIPKEGITIFASISGEGKSLLMMHLAHCLSEGIPWFGYDEFKSVQSKVLYINLEMSVSEMQRRGRKIGFSKDNENLVILNEDSFNLNEEEGSRDFKYKWLLNYIYQHQIKVVIIDTFRAASGGLKEEKAEEVRKFFQKFLVLKNSGVSLIFLEHVRKPTQLEGKIPKKEQLLGSQDKTANAEILLMIRRDESTGNINIYQRKNRLGNEIKPFAVKMQDSLDSSGKEILEFEHAGEIDEDINKKERAKELILEILSSSEDKDVKQLSELTKKEIGSKNLRAGLRELLSLKEIDYYKNGKSHVYFIPKKSPESEEKTIDGHKEDKFFDDS